MADDASEVVRSIAAHHAATLEPEDTAEEVRTLA
jgi:hypothetical protein